MINSKWLRWYLACCECKKNRAVNNGPPPWWLVFIWCVYFTIVSRQLSSLWNECQCPITCVYHTGEPDTLYPRDICNNFFMWRKWRGENTRCSRKNRKDSPKYITISFLHYLVVVVIPPTPENGGNCFTWSFIRYWWNKYTRVKFGKMLWGSVFIFQDSDYCWYFEIVSNSLFEINWKESRSKGNQHQKDKT